MKSPNPNPDIAKCPDGCKEIPITRSASYTLCDRPYEYWGVQCSCGYCGPHGDTELAAIEAHNRIAEPRDTLLEVRTHNKLPVWTNSDLVSFITTLTARCEQLEMESTRQIMALTARCDAAIEALPDVSKLRLINKIVHIYHEDMREIEDYEQLDIHGMADRIEAFHEGPVQAVSQSPVDELKKGLAMKSVVTTTDGEATWASLDQTESEGNDGSN